MKILPSRLSSIDVFRAVTMFFMIIVNDASGVKNLPEWIDHAKGYEDAMGFADTIFPAFLFIVGLSLPFAINNRIKKGDSSLNILFYIITRSAALIIMGFYHVNLEEYNVHAAVLLRPVWELIITFSFFLIWLDYPDTMKKGLRYSLMGIGIIALIAMAIVYKGTDDSGHTVGMHPSWWGILGIIGWSYLVCALIYFLSKGRFMPLLIAFIVLAALNVGAHTGIKHLYLPVIGDSSSASLVMAGVVVSRLYSLLVTKERTQRLWTILLISGVFFIALGLLIRPYAEGISKIRSTPAWVFICTGISILVFEILIYLVDVKGKKDYFKIIRPAGTSTLTCYLLPYFQVALLELFMIRYPSIFNSGLIGLLRSVLTAFIIIWITGFLEKRRLRLKV
jgi:heparan-alpha-glucosaminide N-acetyltransferase